MRPSDMLISVVLEEESQRRVLEETVGLFYSLRAFSHRKQLLAQQEGLARHAWQVLRLAEMNILSVVELCSREETLRMEHLAQFTFERELLLEPQFSVLEELTREDLVKVEKWSRKSISELMAFERHQVITDGLREGASDPDDVTAAAAAALLRRMNGDLSWGGPQREGTHGTDSAQRKLYYTPLAPRHYAAESPRAAVPLFSPKSRSTARKLSVVDDDEEISETFFAPSKPSHERNGWRPSSARERLSEKDRVEQRDLTTPKKASTSKVSRPSTASIYRNRAENIMLSSTGRKYSPSSTAADVCVELDAAGEDEVVLEKVFSPPNTRHHAFVTVNHAIPRPNGENHREHPYFTSHYCTPKPTRSAASSISGHASGSTPTRQNHGAPLLLLLNGKHASITDTKALLKKMSLEEVSRVVPMIRMPKLDLSFRASPSRIHVKEVSRHRQQPDSTQQFSPISHQQMTSCPFHAEAADTHEPQETPLSGQTPVAQSSFAFLTFSSPYPNSAVVTLPFGNLMSTVEAMQHQRIESIAPHIAHFLKEQQAHPAVSCQWCKAARQNNERLSRLSSRHSSSTQLRAEAPSRPTSASIAGERARLLIQSTRPPRPLSARAQVSPHSATTSPPPEVRLTAVSTTVNADNSKCSDTDDDSDTEFIAPPRPAGNLVLPKLPTGSLTPQEGVSSVAVSNLHAASSQGPKDLSAAVPPHLVLHSPPQRQHALKLVDHMLDEYPFLRELDPERHLFFLRIEYLDPVHDESFARLAVDWRTKRRQLEQNATSGALAPESVAALVGAVRTLEKNMKARCEVLARHYVRTFLLDEFPFLEREVDGVPIEDLMVREDLAFRALAEEYREASIADQSKRPSFSTIPNLIDFDDNPDSSDRAKVASIKEKIKKHLVHRAQLVQQRWIEDKYPFLIVPKPLSPLLAPRGDDSGNGLTAEDPFGAEEAAGPSYTHFAVHMTPTRFRQMYALYVVPAHKLSLWTSPLFLDLQQQHNEFVISGDYRNAKVVAKRMLSEAVRLAKEIRAKELSSSKCWGFSNLKAHGLVGGMPLGDAEPYVVWHLIERFVLGINGSDPSSNFVPEMAGTLSYQIMEPLKERTSTKNYIAFTDSEDEEAELLRYRTATELFRKNQWMFWRDKCPFLFSDQRILMATPRTAQTFGSASTPLFSPRGGSGSSSQQIFVLYREQDDWEVSVPGVEFKAIMQLDLTGDKAFVSAFLQYLSIGQDGVVLDDALTRRVLERKMMQRLEVLSKSLGEYRKSQDEIHRHALHDKAAQLLLATDALLVASIRAKTALFHETEESILRNSLKKSEGKARSAVLVDTHADLTSSLVNEALTYKEQYFLASGAMLRRLHFMEKVVVPSRQKLFAQFFSDLERLKCELEFQQRLVLLVEEERVARSRSILLDEAELRTQLRRLHEKELKRSARRWRERMEQLIEVEQEEAAARSSITIEEDKALIAVERERIIGQQKAKAVQRQKVQIRSKLFDDFLQEMQGLAGDEESARDELWVMYTRQGDIIRIKALRKLSIEKQTTSRKEAALEAPLNESQEGAVSSQLQSHRISIAALRAASRENRTKHQGALHVASPTTPTRQRSVSDTRSATEVFHQSFSELDSPHAARSPLVMRSPFFSSSKSLEIPDVRDVRRRHQSFNNIRDSLNVLPATESEKRNEIAEEQKTAFDALLTKLLLDKHRLLAFHRHIAPTIRREERLRLDIVAEESAAFAMIAAECSKVLASISAREREDKLVTPAFHRVFGDLEAAMTNSSKSSAKVPKPSGKVVVPMAGARGSSSSNADLDAKFAEALGNKEATRPSSANKRVHF